MYLFKSLKAVYFRAPGTGSTTFLKHAGEYGLSGDDHSRLEDNTVEIAEKFHDWEKFTIIRNPYKWAITFHTMCARASSHWEEWCEGAHGGHNVSLEDFLDALVVTPLSWVSLNGDVVGNAYKIEDLVALRERFGIKDTLTHQNKKEEEHKGVWTPKALKTAKVKLGKELAFYSGIEEPEAQ